MYYMRPNIGKEALEARRRKAALLLKQGLGVREVARQVRASPSSVKRWKDMVAEGGKDALAARPNTGRPPRMNPGQKGKLLKLLLKGAVAHGYPGDLWTLPRVSQVIEAKFGIQYHPAHVWKILRGCSWSCQKPERRARERDEVAIEQWRKQRWPDIKKRPAAGS